MKKDRKNKRIKRNFERFATKCKKCMSCQADYCADLELKIKDVWKDEHYNMYKCSEFNRRCSFFVNKDTKSKVK